MYIIKIESTREKHEPILVQCDSYLFEGWTLLCHTWSVSAQPTFAYSLCPGDVVNVCRQQGESL